MTVKARAYRFLNHVAPGAVQFFHERQARKALTLFVPTRYGFDISKAAPSLTLRPDWEQHEIRTTLECLSESDVLIDVGANVGFYACLGAKAGKKVVAIEPISSNLRSLYGNLIYNGFDNVEVFPLGLADKPGLRQIFGRGDQSSLVEGWGSEANQTAGLTIPVTTMDALVAQRFAGQSLTIKIDVEGAEHAVLQGAQQVLAMQPRPKWIVEIVLSSYAIPGGTNYRFRETFDIFWSLGYRSFLIGPKDREVLPRTLDEWVNDPTVMPHTPNFLFC